MMQAVANDWSNQKLAVLQTAAIGNYLVTAANFLNAADLVRDGLAEAYNDHEGVRVEATDAGRALAQQLSLVTPGTDGRFNYGSRMPAGKRVLPD